MKGLCAWIGHRQVAVTYERGLRLIPLSRLVNI
jgi:hypothetical protein